MNVIVNKILITQATNNVYSKNLFVIPTFYHNLMKPHQERACPVTYGVKRFPWLASVFFSSRRNTQFLQKTANNFPEQTMLKQLFRSETYLQEKRTKKNIWICLRNAYNYEPIQTV
jgi:hypothetical protein